MTDYDKLTVAKLREELVRRGLPKTGLKVRTSTPDNLNLSY